MINFENNSDEKELFLWFPLYFGAHFFSLRFLKFLFNGGITNHLEIFLK